MGKKAVLGAALMAAILSDPKAIQIPWYRRIFKARSGVRQYRSRYGTPHQGDREKTRRLRQIAAGILKSF